MRCSEGLDTFGKWRSGTDTQPVAFPDEEAIGCYISCIDENGHKLNVIRCESQENSDLNTFCIEEDEGRKFSINVRTMRSQIWIRYLCISIRGTLES